MYTLRASFCAILAGGLIPAVGYSQSTVKPGTVELMPYGGGTFDLPGATGFVGLFQSSNPQNRQEKFNQGRRSQPFVGGRVSVAIAKYLWLYGDYSYLFVDRTKGSVTLGGSSGVNTTDRHYSVAQGGVQLAFPTIQRASPYLEFGMGVLHQNYTTSTSYTNVIGSNPNPFFTQSDRDNIVIGPHAGGGVRIYRGERDGFYVGVDGNYLFSGVRQVVPADGIGSFPTISRRGWGRAYVGYFFRFRRR